VKCYAVSTGK